jgi:DNA mismatch repair protein PMS2
MIAEIPKSLSNTIKSQQYIHSTYIIVKELVENSLDANSSAIKIIIDSGITVEDNGSGIESLESICQAGYTSKEDSTYKVLGIDYKETSFSHGFRGQALASMKELCDIEITTCFRSKEIEIAKKTGSYINFTTGTTKNCAREFGTTVKIYNLFKNCAIRRNLNKKSQKKHISDILKLLEQFCYIYSTHFTLIFKGKTIFSKQGSSNTREFAIENLGDSFLEIREDYFDFLLFPFSKSKFQCIFLERRIVNCAKITNLINSKFRKHFEYNPSFILNLKDEADVNISIDKSEVILKNYKFIESKLKSEIDLYFSSRMYFNENLAAEERIDTDLPSNDSPTQTNSNVLPAKAFNNPEKDSKAAMKDESKSEIVSYDSFSFLKSESNGVISFNEIENTVKEELLEIQEPENIFDTKLAKKIKSQESLNSSLSTAHSSPRSLSSSFNSAYSCAYAYLKDERLEHPDIIIEKSDFKKMKILGQFNQGFIVCTLEKNNCTFLITVDQHAADEIYNFEKLRKSFILKKQKLVIPEKLEISAIQSLLIEQNLEVLDRNGFIYENEHLVAVPCYKNRFFGKEDFYSLLENISNSIYESDRFRDIMASKACRTSVMIGSAVGMNDMRRIVDNLSFLDLPWNCPHGRPTFKIISKF